MYREHSIQPTRIRFLMFNFLLSFSLLLFFSTSAIACDAYDRKAWKHWVDVDKDCQNTRHEVLLEESVGLVTCKTSKNCRAVSDSQLGAYSGDVLTNASQLDMDRILPFKETHESEGFALDAYN